MVYKRGATWYLRFRWHRLGDLRLSTKSKNKNRAQAMERVVNALRDAGRWDLLGLLADGRVTLPDLYTAWQHGSEDLEQLRARAESPALGELVDEWLRALPSLISRHTRRRYAASTVRRYEVSWSGIFEALPRGRKSHLSDLTTGFFSDYRANRRKAGGGVRRLETEEPPSPSTLNRDGAAVRSFLNWAEQVKELAVHRPTITREREPAGLTRWLTPEEIAAFEACCPDEQWPFFACLLFTGVRLGEAQALRGGDVQLSVRRLEIHETDHRLKSHHSVRTLPIPAPLIEPLARQLARIRPTWKGLIFPGDFESQDRVRTMWDRICEAAEIEGSTPHVMRHTYGVHAAQAGVPIPRLQELLGHAGMETTLRYIRHSASSYLDVDADAIASSMTAQTEADARRRAGLRPV